MAMDLSHFHDKEDYIKLSSLKGNYPNFMTQLKLYIMNHCFKRLFDKLQLMWDEYGIPYKKRKKMLLVEIEMVSLLMCGILIYNYSEQYIWVNDKSQEWYYNYFKAENVDSGHKRLLDLLAKTTYKTGAIK